MKAAVLYEIGKPLVIEEIELDQPKENEILVKLEATGVCHSDLHFMQGDMPQPMPFVPGHEGAGVVEAMQAVISGEAWAELPGSRRWFSKPYVRDVSFSRHILRRRL